MSGWIGVDLDGTLAYYDGWKGPDQIGDPIPLMVGRVKGWLDKGLEVRIFTARVSHDGTPASRNSAAVAHNSIRQWCEAHIGRELPITNAKDYGMISLYDDRCVQVEENTGILIGKGLRALL